MTSRSRLWLVAALSAVVVFGVPLIAADALAERDPEIRLVRTGDNFSALIVTDRSRVLIINSDDRGTTRSATGLLARPWEADVRTVIAPADDRSGVGLWEALRHPEIEQILIVGLPGSNPIWSAIERECRERDIAITYVAEESEVRVESLILTIAPARNSGGPSVTVRRNDASVVLSLSGETSFDHRSHVAVVNKPNAVPANSDLAIIPDSPDATSRVDAVIAREREVVRIIVRDRDLRIRGGHVVLAEEPAN